MHKQTVPMTLDGETIGTADVSLDARGRLSIGNRQFRSRADEARALGRFVKFPYFSPSFVGPASTPPDREAMRKARNKRKALARRKMR